MIFNLIRQAKLFSSPRLAYVVCSRTQAMRIAEPGWTKKNRMEDER